MPFLEIEALEKRYDREHVLRGVSLGVDEHETLAVLGRSGSGTTTLLKLIAGLDAPDAGRIALGGRSLAGVPPQARGAVYLSQEPLLFPHLDVFENVAFALRLRRTPDAAVRHRVGELLGDLGLADHARKRPDALSGGQQQRAAFGRAVVAGPALLLLDEPFGKLDVETRASVQALFGRLIHAHGITSVFVTHDLKEALVVGDRFGLMDAGALRVYGSRQAFVDDPATGVRDEAGFWNALQRGDSQRDADAA